MTTWRRRQERLLQESVDASTAAAIAANEAKLAAQDAAEAARAVAEEPSTLNRVVTLAAVCVLATAFSIGALTRAAPAFIEPAAVASSDGLATLVVQTTGNESRSAAPFKTERKFYVSALVSQTGVAIYELFFPGDLVGRKFALLLQGGATILMPAVSVNKLQAHFVDCPRDHGKSISDNCEVIYGQIPKTDGDPAVQWNCEESNQPNYSIVLIPGMSSSTSRLDWAHHTTSISNFNFPDSSQSETIWRQVLDGHYATPASQSDCRSLHLNADWKTADVSVNPTSTQADTLTWGSTTPIESVAVVSTDRNAAAVGNIWLAIAGAFAALGIGFIPIVYEAATAWRRARRRELLQTL